MTIAFVGLPAATRSPLFTKLLRIDDTRGQHVVVLSREIVGVPVHWDQRAGTNGRGFACSAGYCPRCRAGSGVRWRGYFSGLVYPKWTHKLVEITDGAARQLQAILERGDGNNAFPLRGLGLKLWRRKASATAPMDLAVWEYQGRSETMPEPLDVPKLVSNIWSSDESARVVSSPFDVA